MKVLDEQDDAGSGVGSSDADVVESAVVAEGDRAGLVDFVVADAVVGVGVAFEYGNTNFFVEVPTSNTFFRLLCLTERIFTAAPQPPAR